MRASALWSVTHTRAATSDASYASNTTRACASASASWGVMLVRIRTLRPTPGTSGSARRRAHALGSYPRLHCTGSLGWAQPEPSCPNSGTSIPIRSFSQADTNARWHHFGSGGAFSWHKSAGVLPSASAAISRRTCAGSRAASWR